MFDNSAFYICLSSSFILSVIIAFLLMQVLHFRKLSERDEMTSIMNYRGISKQIERLIHKNKSFSLAIIDIDNFSVFNKHSYKLGDDVLKEFAVLLYHSFSHDVLIARFRIGDEFIIVFQNSDIMKAKMGIDEFKEKCRNYNFKCLEPISLKQVNFSEGLTQRNTKNNSLELLFSEAERCLRESKTKTSAHNK